MPIDYKNYPKNWKEISDATKASANWRCECCGMLGLTPDEDRSSLTLSERARITLQTHHKDFNPHNNQDDNLMSLCSKCHLNIHRQRFSAYSPGQLTLEWN